MFYGGDNLASAFLNYFYFPLVISLPFPFFPVSASVQLRIGLVQVISIPALMSSGIYMAYAWAILLV